MGKCSTWNIFPGPVLEEKYVIFVWESPRTKTRTELARLNDLGQKALSSQKLIRDFHVSFGLLQRPGSKNVPRGTFLQNAPLVYDPSGARYRRVDLKASLLFSILSFGSELMRRENVPRGTFFGTAHRRSPELAWKMQHSSSFDIAKSAT